MIKIRPERREDIQIIKEINDLAFRQENESKLIAALRANPEFNPDLSLVALIDNQIVGHILFFPAHIQTRTSLFKTLSLAPMAVHPDYQKKGIGGALIRQGIQSAKNLGYASIIVLGHPEYYPKFGFKKASRWGIKLPLDAPDEANMAMELIEGAFDNAAGIIVYPEEYNVVL